MTQEDNQWGVQKVPEAKVRSGGAVAADAGKGAAAVAAMGTHILPGWGTAIGAVVGAVAGGVGSKLGKVKERKKKYAADQQNQ